ncbi:hypothetical protein L208DRAFT_1404800 [Tricholoma matsutake]|nr:hypothetical protein L208DRAFT_1404800 [Tricholoma matsutake 945]
MLRRNNWLPHAQCMAMNRLEQQYFNTIPPSLRFNGGESPSLNLTLQVHSHNRSM